MSNYKSKNIWKLEKTLVQDIAESEDRYSNTQQVSSLQTAVSVKVQTVPARLPAEAAVERFRQIIRKGSALKKTSKIVNRGSKGSLRMQSVLAGN